MRPGVPARAREILEHGLARDAGIGVGAGRRCRRRRLGRAAAMHVDVGIHAAGRIGDDARARECLGDQRRHVRVHRPGQVLVAGGAELAAGHEHHVGELRQRLDLPAVEQIGGDALDAAASSCLAQARFAEARHADHALARRRPLGEPRQGRPDLAADAQDDEITGKRAELGGQAAGGVVITSSRCSTSWRRSGMRRGRCRHPAFPQPVSPRGDAARATASGTASRNPRIFATDRPVLFQIAPCHRRRAPTGRPPRGKLAHPLAARYDDCAPLKKRHPDALVSCRRAGGVTDCRKPIYGGGRDE